MATKLFLRSTATSDYSTGNNDTRLNGVASGWLNLALSTTAGSSLSTQTFTTVAGPTNGLEGTTGSSGRAFISPPLDADATISGSITWNIWASEVNMADNVAINGRLEVIDGATGVITLIDQTARVTEVAQTTRGVNNFSETPGAGVACKRGDRLRVRIFGDDLGATAMGAGGSFTFSLNGGSAGVDGDTWLQLTENLTFVSEPAGTTIYPTDTASPVSGAASLLSDFSGGTETVISEGGNWAALNSSVNSLTRSSLGNLGPNGSGSGSYWTPTNFGPDVEAYATYVTLPTTARWGLAARIQGEGGAGTWDGYYVYATDTNTISIDRVDNATRTNLATTSVTWTADDKLGISCHGNSIQAWQYTGGVWILRLTASDSTYSSAGKVGVWAATLTSGSPRFDDLYAGTVAATFTAEREAWTSRGAGVQTDVTNTAAGWTAPLHFTDTAGGTVVDWFTRPLTAFTLGGAVRVNARLGFSSASNAASVRCEVARVAGDGTSASVWAASTYYDNGSLGTNLSTSETAYSFLVSGDDLAVSDGERLRIRLYVDDSGQSPLLTSQTATLYYAGTSGGASGDTYLTFTQTLYELPTGTTVYLTDTASAVATASVDLEAWTSPGPLLNGAVTASSAGPIAQKQATYTSGGTVVDWFTRPLTAFTLDAPILVNVWARESGASANAILRCEIARVAGDGTSPSVWATADIVDTELTAGSSSTLHRFVVAGSSLAISDNERLRIRFYFDDAPGQNMGAGNTLTISFAGTSGGVSGDTYLTFTQTLTESSAGETADAELATGTGAASNISGHIMPTAGHSTGTGDAATSRANVAPNAGTSTGTGAAADATVTVGGAAKLRVYDIEVLIPVAAEGTVSAGVASGSGAAGDVRAHIQPNAGLASGTGAAGNASVLISAFAEAATGTGSAGAVSAHVKPNTGLASGTGSAGNATGVPNELTPADAASGTGTASQPSVAIAVNALLASGTGTASGASALVAVNAGQASGTGTAFNATASTVSTLNVFPEVASGTGAAYGASVLLAPNAGLGTGIGTANGTSGHVAPRAQLVTGTGAALDATILAAQYRYGNAEVASGTGAALGVSASIKVNALAATGSGAANDATAQTASSVNATAEAATGTGAVLQTSVAIAPSAGSSTGTGTTSASANVQPNASIASGTGTAFNATVLTAEYRYAAAELASGTGAAGGVSAHVQPNAGLASGTGAAFNAAVAGSSNTYANAEAANGTGSAGSVSVAIAPNAAAALGLGGAASASASVAPSAGSAGGAGAALGSSARTATSAQAASGTGDSGTAHANVAPNAGLASGTGVAFNATASTTSSTNVFPEAASGSGSALGASTHVQPTAGSASGTGAAHNATASAQAQTNAAANAATGTGSAFVASVHVQPRPQAASGTGQALNASGRPATSVSAGVATGTGSAFDASTREGRYTQAEAATGTGQSSGPSAAIAVSAGIASGAGAAYTAFPVSIVASFAFAEVAEGTGSALGASAHVQPHAGLGSGSSHPGSDQGRAYAEISIGTGITSTISADLVGSTITISTDDTVYATLSVDGQGSSTLEVEGVMALID